jgi:hypothetical protein
MSLERQGLLKKKSNQEVENFMQQPIQTQPNFIHRQPLPID